MRRWLGRLERSARGRMNSILLKDGSTYYFGVEDLKEAFLTNMAFLHARAEGEEPPPPTELQLALQNAATWERWHDAYSDSLDEDLGPVPDLSEP